MSAMSQRDHSPCDEKTPPGLIGALYYHQSWLTGLFSYREHYGPPPCASPPPRLDQLVEEQVPNLNIASSESSALDHAVSDGESVAFPSDPTLLVYDEHTVYQHVHVAAFSSGTVHIEAMGAFGGGRLRYTAATGGFFIGGSSAPLLAAYGTDHERSSGSLATCEEPPASCRFRAQLTAFGSDGEGSRASWSSTDCTDFPTEVAAAAWRAVSQATRGEVLRGWSPE